jgi:Co/Zn/Cd efflux system component
MTIKELKSKYLHKEYKYGIRSEAFKRMKQYYPTKYETHNSFLFAFLCCVYDGKNRLEDIKNEMRVLFISSTKQVIVGEEDVEEYFQLAKRQELINVSKDDFISLTEEGEKLVESSYYHNLYISHYLHRFLSTRTVMLATTIFLILLSSLKIIFGLQLSSQGMLTDGFENLTDLIKIGIIGIIGLRLKKDKVASIIIITLMMVTGGTLVWSGIESLIEPSPVVPSIQAYFVSILSIFLNLGLVSLKSMVGRASGNLSFLSDSKDSALNVQISVGVIIGLTFAIFKVYFVDALVGIVIAVLVFKEGIEVLREIFSKEEEFDITSIKVFSDNIYNNRLTGYILGSIRRKNLTREELLDNFSRGLTLGRLYYEGFADFFYDELGIKVANKHIDKLINGKYIESVNKELFLTSKGLKAFYDAKAKEFKQRSSLVRTSHKSDLKAILYLLIVAVIIIVLIFAPQINSWFANL